MGDTTVRPIRILLADDEPGMIAGMKSWLADKPDLAVVETASNHDDVVQMAKLLRPDVIVLDIQMPEQQFNAKQVVKLLRQQENAPQIVMHSNHWGREYIDYYLGLGATGFLTKRAGHDYMVEAIRAVMVDEIYYGRRIFKWINRPTPFSQLTTQEFEVLRRVAGGHTNAEIGDSLCIVEGTAKVHVGSILNKMNVNNRGRLIVLALTNGIEPFEPPQLDW